jgi:hypothetical protein
MKSTVKHKLFSKKIRTELFLALVFFFILGFILGWSFSDDSLSKSQLSLEETQLNLNSFYQAISFSSEFSVDVCSEELVNFMENQLYDLAKQLVDLEKKNLVDQNNYILLKKKYNLNQVLFYTFYKKHYETCSNAKDIVLFFFNSSDVEKSEEQGSILDNLVKNYGVRVIAMDYGFDDSLGYFYSYYDQGELPTLVLNYNKTFTGIVSYETLENEISR